MKHKLFLAIEVRDREGKLLRKFTRKAHSYLKAYNQLIHVLESGTSETITDTGNTGRVVGATTNNLNMPAAAGSVLTGIIFGKGSTAVVITDYAIGTLIDEGTGTDDLNYQLLTFTEPTVAGSDCSFTVVRSAINNSGVAVVVTESAIYCKGASTPYYFCVVRDVLASSVSVPDGGAITATYTIKVSV